MLFSFWRVPNSSRIGDCAFLNTSFPCFFFLACAGALFHRQLRLSAHVISLLFLFGVCRCSLSSATTPLRTRHFLAFSFWRVQALSFIGNYAFPHTSFPCFFFLACAGALFRRRLRLPAHVFSLLSLLWRVQVLSRSGERPSPHTSFPYFPFSDVCRAPLEPANTPLRTNLPLYYNSG